MDWGTEEEFIALEEAAQPSPILDSGQRTRLRSLLGPPVASGLRPSSGGTADPHAGPLAARQPLEPTAEERLLDLSFVLSDLDRKLDKVLGMGERAEQLGEQLGRLGERMARIEALLTAQASRRAV